MNLPLRHGMIAGLLLWMFGAVQITPVRATEEPSMVSEIVSNTAQVVKKMPHGVLTNSTAVVGEILKPVEMQPKPSKFNNFAERLDYIHLNLYNDYNTRVIRADRYVGRNLDSLEKPVASRFRLGLYAQIAQEDSIQFAFSPDFDAEIELPNLEKAWNIIVNTVSPAELPSADPTERNNDLRFGVGTVMDKLDLRTEIGVRATWLPTAYAILKWGQAWKWGLWNARPSQKVFYETDEGFGEQTALSVYRWFGEKSRLAAGTISAGTFSESTDGLEWEQSFKIGYIRELIEETDRGGAVSGADMARGVGFRYTIMGSDTILTEHRVVLGHRRPIYKRWIYLDLQPGIKWENDSDWSTDPFLLFGLDFLFWGSHSR